jgi:hypothetical protein
MRTFFRATVVALVIVFAAAKVGADSGQISAFIPFEFTVRGTTLPAGTYTVSPQVGSLDVLSVNHRTGGVYLLGNRVHAADAKDGATRMTFHRYGDRYFLNQVWLGSGMGGFTLPETIEERELAKPQSGAPPLTTVTIFVEQPSKALSGRS